MVKSFWMALYISWSRNSSLLGRDKMNGEDQTKKIQEQEAEKIKKDALRKILTKEAIERLGRIRIVNPTMVQQVELYLLQLYQLGQIRDVIDDNKLKEILLMLKKDKKWNIKRR